MVYPDSINETERNIIDNYLNKGKKVDGFWELVQVLRNMDIRKMNKDRDLVRRFLVRAY